MDEQLRKGTRYEAEAALRKRLIRRDTIFGMLAKDTFVGKNYDKAGWQQCSVTRED